jgi:hypothetical protein
MVTGSLKWYDENANNPPWVKALAEVRHRATREGWCYPHVQAIIVAIDQYAEAALGNREFFLNKPYGIGGSRKETFPSRVLSGGNRSSSASCSP